MFPKEFDKCIYQQQKRSTAQKKHASNPSAPTPQKKISKYKAPNLITESRFETRFPIQRGKRIALRTHAQDAAHEGQNMVITARGLAGAHMDIVGRDPRGFGHRTNPINPPPNPSMAATPLFPPPQRPKKIFNFPSDLWGVDLAL